MKPFQANLILAVLALVFGIWSYFSSETPSFTALIPSIFGAVLLACHNGIKTENKVIAHVAVVLTLVFVLSLFMPLKGSLDRGNMLAVGRIVLMLLAGIFAMVLYIKSFRDARIKREAAAKKNS